MSGGEPRNPVARTETRLALAVGLVDGHTGQSLTAGEFTVRRTERTEATDPRVGDRQTPTVALPGLDVSPVVNASGYVLLFEADVPEDVGSIAVEVSGGEWYLDEERTVELDAFDTGDDPVETVTLRPRPAYPFSAGTTLVRGHVFALDEDHDLTEPLSPAKHGHAGVPVSLDGFDRTTETVEGGEYVLALTGLTADDVENGQVRVAGLPPTLRIAPEGLDPVAVSAPLREGRTHQYQFRYDADGTATYWPDAADGWRPI